MSDIDYRKLIRGELQPKLSRTRRAVFLTVMLLLFAGMVYFAIDYENKPQYVLPPKYNTENQTFDMVLSFMKRDNTDTIPYEEGFNCVDSVFRVWLNARWQGIKAVPIAIQYEEAPGHMVVGFPTIDRGDVFFDTLNDQQIRLTVGKNYNGRKVRGFYYMDATWSPLANSPEYDTSMEIK